MAEEINNYDGDSIKVLKGLEAVRLRPGMYIGSTTSVGLHHLVWEIVDNGIDEALAGYATHVTVTIEKDNSITVSDDGRGVPTSMNHEEGKPAMELVYTVLHAGGKFDEGSYKVSGGLHGVGASVVNALSSKMDVRVYRDGKIYYMDFERGHVTTEMKNIDEEMIIDRGTIVHFTPDASIFRETTVFNYNILLDRVRELAFLNKGLRLSITDKRVEPVKSESFHFEGGIGEYVSYLNKNKVPVFPDPIYVEGTYSHDEKDQNGNSKTINIEVEVALQYTDAIAETLMSFTNNIHTHEGGTHESGFKTALTRIINDYAKKNNLIKESEESLTGEDVREGLTAIVSIKHPDPQFEGQTKTKLGNSDGSTAVNYVFAETFNRFLLENPDTAKEIVAKGMLAARARVAAKKARDLTRKKSGLEISALAGKLADNTSKDPEISELFIVEGDSAGGSAKQARSRLTQAIMPVRGKVLNVEKATLDKVLANEEIRSLFTAIGTGFGSEFDVTKAKYHKIIIMTDADVDGAHITTLLLTLFFRYMRPLIDAGYIYIAQPPLYGVAIGNSEHRVFLDSDEELDQYVGSLTTTTKPRIQRYKGLGEMDASQLWETTMDPENRRLLRVNPEYESDADTTFDMLMGDRVEPRRIFIEDNAQFVENLDV
jgi:DNA gyrase subunit B